VANPAASICVVLSISAAALGATTEENEMRIESLLSARIHLSPELSDRRLYFISNLSGRLSLYAMDARPGGSVPEPLLPPQIALQNPHLMEGYAFHVFPRLKKILVMLDRDGDENYQPMLIPLTGGYPEPAFGDSFAGDRVHCLHVDDDKSLVYLNAESRSEQKIVAWEGNLSTGKRLKLGVSKWGSFVAGVSEDRKKAILSDGYTVGDNVLYLWERGDGQRRLLFGTPLESRKEQPAKLPAIGACYFTNTGLLFTTALFSDTYGLGYFDLKSPTPEPVKITGLVHHGAGELVGCRRLVKNRYLLEYNIDGCSWLYEGKFDDRTMKVRRLFNGPGVLGSVSYDKKSDTFALSYSTATSPTQIYTLKNGKLTQHTRERVLGIAETSLSPGEDASFTSFDGTRISARLYLPKQKGGPWPVIYYVHGGPQSQERPDFAWFSMPLIQFLTLNGFAVFVPNARGSTGYGLSYTKKVDRDWGGADRLDHVHAMTVVLPKDKRLDVKRAGVVGRSYGGYMTLTLASRHPELWSAAVDMFGPYDLTTFVERIPETWKPYFTLAIGDPVKDRNFLLERSPQRYVGNIRCPLLVIQGKNDPRVIERESRDVVEALRAQGKSVEYLMFEDEGHDVLKHDNRVRCYNAIAEFFRQNLKP
jgi:pimeloyl-ACP methyl ester carboxylesterase